MASTDDETSRAPAPEAQGDPMAAGNDPWAGQSLGAPRQTFTGVEADRQDGLAPMRVIHDIPPTWSGANPDKELEPYLKLLKGWLATTRTLKAQQGMTILQFATADLKLIINELEIEDLTADTSGQIVLKHIQTSYAEYTEKKLPQAIENGIYDSAVQRKKGEGMLPYVLRRDKLFKKLAKEGWDIPDEAKGYILLRDAHLPDKARDLLEMWTSGVYSYPEIQKCLKRLERPVPGSTQQRITGLIGFIDEDRPEPASTSPETAVLANVDSAAVYMGESLFVLPEAFDDDLLEEAAPYLDNTEILYVAGDLADDLVFSEDESIALLANYGQVRNYLHKKTLNRGFFKSTPPSNGKGGGKGAKKPLRAITNGSTPPPPRPHNTARPKMWDKASLIARTKCARCGQIGHWARTCTNPPDERGKRRIGTSGFQMATDAPSQSFLMCSFVLPQALDTFIGLLVTPGYGLIDTGAQHGVCGPKDYERLCERLAAQGLKPRELETFQANAVGVGGSTNFIKTVESPMAIQGVSGLLTINVIDTNLPLLLPMGFCKKLGMVLDTTENTATWKNLGDKVSDVVSLDSDHIAIDILEFPEGGWQNPHQNPCRVTDRPKQTNIPRSAFEVQSTVAALLKTSESQQLQPVLPSARNSQRGGNHVSASMPSSATVRTDAESQYREVFQRGRGGTVIRVREIVPLESPVSASIFDIADRVPDEQSQDLVGNPSLQPDVPTEAGTPTSRPRELPLREGTSGRETTSTREGRQRHEETTGGSSDVCSQRPGHAVPSQQNHQMVDLQEVPVPMGTPGNLGGDQRDTGTSASGPCDLRQTHRGNLPGGMPEGPGLLQVAAPEHGGGGGPRAAEEVGHIRPQSTVGGDVRSGSVPGIGRRNGAVVNKLVHGTSLAAMFMTVSKGQGEHRRLFRENDDDQSLHARGRSGIFPR